MIVCSEEILAVLASAYRDIDQEFRARRGRDLASYGTQEVALVGWSEEHGRMQTWIYRQEKPGGPFFASSFDTKPSIGPWHASIGNTSRPESLEDLKSLARFQVQLIRENAPGAPAGGKLIRVHLERDTMTIDTACVL